MNDITFRTTGHGIISTYFNQPEVDKRPRHEKFFGMTEDEIYKEYGLVFTKTDISIGNEVQYKISSDFEAELWMIKKGFIKYVRGRKVWHDQALDEGWENAWTPPEDYKKNNKSNESGHVYFIRSQGDHKIGCSNKTRIKRRVIGQCPEKILAISKPVKDFKAWEKRLHKKYQENRVLKYEIFRNLTEKQISDIIEEIGGVNIDL